MNIKTEDTYEYIANEIQKRFYTWNYAIERPLPIGKNKKMIRLMRDELGGKIITEFVGLRPKTYSYLIDDDSGDKKVKGAKKCVTKRILKFKGCKNCLKYKRNIIKSTTKISKWST